MFPQPGASAIIVPIVEMMLNTTMAGKTVGQFLEDFLGPIL
jgi:hypothetical protein